MAQLAYLPVLLFDQLGGDGSLLSSAEPCLLHEKAAGIKMILTYRFKFLGMLLELREIESLASGISEWLCT